MKIVLSHTTALRLYRDEKLRSALRSGSSLAGAYADCRFGHLVKGIKVQLGMGVGDKLDVLFSNAELRSKSRHVRAHVAKANWDAGDFQRLNESVYVTGPELTLLLCANALGGCNGPELLATICELCGSYRLVGGLSGERHDALPVTSVNKLEAVLPRYGGIPNAVSFEGALKYCFDGSRSPRETALALILTLPARSGGYGLPKPLMNHPVAMPGLQEVSELRPDLFWPEANLAVEFESGEFHAGDRFGVDSWRRTALNNCGVDVVTVTSYQLNNPEYLEQVVRNIARRLGVRVRPRAKDFPAQHKKLCDVLLRQRSQRDSLGGISNGAPWR